MKRILLALTAFSACILMVADHPAAAQNNDWGTIKGQVTFAGAIPALKPLKVDKDQAHCLMKGPIPDETWIINPKNKGVRNTVVWLQPEKGAAPLRIHPDQLKPKQDKVILDQPCCKFEPRIVAMRQEQKLVVKNTAPVAHNVKYTSIRNPSNNVLVPAGGEHELPTLSADHLPMSIECNIHPWMRAYVRIYNHPYFAVTDANGGFEIKNAPAGKYRLVSWHEATGWGQGGRDGIEITIKGGAAVEPKLELKEAKP